MNSTTPRAEQLIEDLARTLEIPEARYLAADRSYKSVSQWLERDGSKFADQPILVYTQGSFRLGTAIRPINDEEHYDLDIVCEFGRSKLQCTQQELHQDLGDELKLYADRHSMDQPDDWDRCWTLNYADQAQFHMDILPSVPDGARQRLLRESLSLTLDYVDRSISITDKRDTHYKVLSTDWPVSNPNGYADWFYERMKPIFDALRKSIMLDEAKADVAEIPVFRVKTPLQSAIQILKRHRDLYFEKNPDQRPSSIVITTLAAHAYQQETSVTGALFSILENMDHFIETRDANPWIANPSNPRENFADYWNKDRDLYAAFQEWLSAARSDFEQAGMLSDPQQLTDTLSPCLGKTLVEKAIAFRPEPTRLAKVTGAISRSFQKILNAPHRKAPQWPILASGSVELASVTVLRPGFRPEAVDSDYHSVVRGSSLRFAARTDVPRPFKVYWQIVNTGATAEAIPDLRGGFDESQIEIGNLVRNENAKYPGTHSIECFIVKDGYCVARSGIFIVNIV